MIQYIYQKYGEHHAAMVCTVITYRSRMATREVAKVLGLEPTKIDALIQFMGREGLARLTQSPDEISRFGLTDSTLQILLSSALQLRGFPRHLGIHTGGFVISHEAITDIVPVESATMENRHVIQWNKDEINILGLMKIDVLSLGMLTALRKCLNLLRDHKAIDWNLARIPAEDEPTYQMIQKADTIGAFQIESRAQMSLLPRLKPRTYYDLVIEVAMIRPGPIQGGMVHPYLRRRTGKEKIHYPHPALIPILGKTLGVPIFQEQVMRIVVAVAGFTPGEADELRRIMSSSWRKPMLMDGIRQRVINGMLSHGLSRGYAEQIYRAIEGFASYGFPESHAASFALLTYASSYLKRHHPEAFVCALLNSQPMGFYSPRQLIADAQRHHVVFLPLDAQESDWDYTLEKGPQSLAVRTGFRALRGLRESEMRTLTEERSRGGRFRDFKDLIRRTRLPRGALMRLAAAGALTSFGLTPREAVWILQGSCFDSQSLLFGSSISSTVTSTVSPSEGILIPRESPWDKVQRDYQTKGFSLESHPMSVLRPFLKKRGLTTSNRLAALKNSARLRVAGLMSLLQKPPTAKGMCFVSLEDETGFFNIVITPDIYQKHRLTLLNTPLLEIDGVLESHEGVINIKAQNIRPLMGAEGETAPRLSPRPAKC